jgi:hypothetical protein
MKTNQITSKRKSSSKLYIDALQENYAKVNVHITENLNSVSRNT